MSGTKGHRLSRVLERITQLFEERITPHEVWIKAEVSSFKVHSSGHAYLDLVEEREGAVVARCRATLWRGQSDIIKASSKLDPASILEDGREVLCQCRIIYHPVYGLSMHILDIDSSFALGEVEKRRKENILRLKKNGLLHLNRQLVLPRVIQRIALIAAEGSAGIADFRDQLHQNTYGFQFYLDHFNASVQGRGASASIRKAYDSINVQEYDAIVVLRGGGAALDLDVFNDYELNAVLATSPIPILVGIGHETDRTVMDEWAAKSLKTPSAVGAWLVERARDFEIEVSTTYQSIMELYRTSIDREKNKQSERSQSIVHLAQESGARSRRILEHHTQVLAIHTERSVQRSKEAILHSSNNIAQIAQSQLNGSVHSLQERIAKLDRFSAEIQVRSRSKLDMLVELVELYSPESTVKRGYAIVRKDDRIATNITQLKVDDQIEIVMKKGQLEAVIKNIKSNG